MAFAFENLQIYQGALDWINTCEDLIEAPQRNLTRAQSDQLSRAAMSVALNIAEGNGRWHKAEKRNFYWIARGAVFEMAAILQILERRNKISKTEYQSFYPQLEEMAKMLTGLVKAVDGLACEWGKR